MATSPNLTERNWNPSIASLADSPVRTCLKLESESVSKDLGQVFGLSSRAWWANFDHDTYSLRTSQVCLFTMQCEELSENWPDCGTWDLGSVYELRTLELPIYENVSLSSRNWKTPHGMSNRDFRGKVGGCGGGEFAKQANQWQECDLLPDPLIPVGLTSSESGLISGRLNPRFVEWLMGFPVSWTEL